VSIGFDLTKLSLNSAKKGNFLLKQAKSASLIAVATALGSGTFLHLTASSRNMFLAALVLAAMVSSSRVVGQPELDVQD
jgi:hypothetical protein